jgi:acyl-coenzyme A synthetase/AMP-(fatty) acid ligase
VKKVAPTDAIDRGRKLGPRWAVDWPELGSVQRRRLLDSLPLRSFSTSGTSGRSVTWLRTGEQLRTELAVTRALLPTSIDAVCTTVNPSTLYGYVGLLLGLELGVPTVYDEWALSGDAIGGRHPLIVTVPPSWSNLFPSLVASPTKEATFVHAGSRLPSLALDVLNAIRPRDELIELFGSTETGLIAHRRAWPPPGARWWELVGDVKLGKGRVDHGCGEEELVVTSSRVGIPDGESATSTVATGDWIVRQGRGFYFEGRRSSRCKPGGRPVDLDDLEDRIASVLGTSHLMCVPVEHARLGEHIELLLVSNRSSDSHEVLDRLRRAALTIPIVPCAVRTVDHIDRSPMGKIRRIAILGGHGES